MDPEIDAMSNIAAAIEPLEPEARERVLRWVADRFELDLGATTRKYAKPGANPLAEHEEVRRSDDADGEYEHLGDLYDAASPRSDADKALVAALWLQKYEGQDSLESQPVNTALKHLGHGIGNITRAFTALKGTKPALVIQLEKQGKTKQARKRYKVTRAGEAHVESMIASASNAA